MTPKTIIAETPYQINVKFDRDYNQYFAYILNTDGCVVGETMFSKTRQGAARLARVFIFNADHDLILSTVY